MVGWFLAEKSIIHQLLSPLQIRGALPGQSAVGSRPCPNLSLDGDACATGALLSCGTPQGSPLSPLYIVHAVYQTFAQARQGMWLCGRCSLLSGMEGCCRRSYLTKHNAFRTAS